MSRKRTGLVVVPASTAHAQRLRRGDLHVVDAVGVPQRLEEGVGESGHQQVLHALLAEVVVDPEDLVLLEHRTDGVVDLERRGQVAADRLLEDQSRARRDQPVLGEAFADRSEERRADGEVEDPDAVRVVELRGQVRPAVAALDVDADVRQAGDEPVEGWRVELTGAYEAGQLAADLVAVAVVVQPGARERDDAASPAAAGRPGRAGRATAEACGRRGRRCLRRRRSRREVRGRAAESIGSSLERGAGES